MLHVGFIPWRHECLENWVPVFKCQCSRSQKIVLHPTSWDVALTTVRFRGTSGGFRMFIECRWRACRAARGRERSAHCCTLARVRAVGMNYRTVPLCIKLCEALPSPGTQQVPTEYIRVYGNLIVGCEKVSWTRSSLHIVRHINSI